jgi:hypothetical protein
MKRKEPTRLEILQEIFEHFQQVTQWMPCVSTDADYSNGVTKYLFKAEALVEMLEVTDCGSTGGFDAGQECHGLYARFIWLVNKYHKTSDIKPSCNFTPDDLYKYFSEAGQLRNKIAGE